MGFKAPFDNFKQHLRNVFDPGAFFNPPCNIVRALRYLSREREHRVGQGYADWNVSEGSRFPMASIRFAFDAQSPSRTVKA
jgi:hypothetical protein